VDWLGGQGEDDLRTWKKYLEVSYIGEMYDGGPEVEVVTPRAADQELKTSGLRLYNYVTPSFQGGSFLFAQLS